MADDNMALLETLRKVTAEGDVDVLREAPRRQAIACVVGALVALAVIARLFQTG